MPMINNYTASNFFLPQHPQPLVSVMQQEQNVQTQQCQMDVINW